MGYRAAKTLEKTPATMDSQVTRTLERRVAKSRLSVAMSAAESVGADMLSFCSTQEKSSDSGVTPMRASW
jgi:hypothetical protein